LQTKIEALLRSSVNELLKQPNDKRSYKNSIFKFNIYIWQHQKLCIPAVLTVLKFECFKHILLPMCLA